MKLIKGQPKPSQWKARTGHKPVSKRQAARLFKREVAKLARKDAAWTASFSGIGGSTVSAAGFVGS